MCECIKKIAKENYVHPDILHQNTYFLYPIVFDNGKGKVYKTGLLLNYCPICGGKLNSQVLS